MKGPTVACGNCKQPINLKTDRWTKRRVRGHWREVCAPCAKALDTQLQIEQDLAERGDAA